MVKIMAMVNGQLKEVNSKEMFESLINEKTTETRDEVKKAINSIYGLGAMSEREEKEENVCNCPACQLERILGRMETKEKSMNQVSEEDEMLLDILNSIEESLDESIKKLIDKIKEYQEEDEEDEILHMEKAYGRISDLEYEMETKSDELRLKLNEYNELDIKGIVKGITKKELERHKQLENEIGELKVELTEYSKEKRDILESLE